MKKYKMYEYMGSEYIVMPKDIATSYRKKIGQELRKKGYQILIPSRTAMANGCKFSMLVDGNIKKTFNIIKKYFPNVRHFRGTRGFPLFEWRVKYSDKGDLYKKYMK